MGGAAASCMGAVVSRLISPHRLVPEIFLVLERCCSHHQLQGHVNHCFCLGRRVINMPYWGPGWASSHPGDCREAESPLGGRFLD